MSYNQIIRAILLQRGIRIGKSHVSDWVSGKHHPFGSVYEIRATPTPELAYLMGVAKGDGSIRVQKWNHRIRLRVIDREFAEEFDRCASIVLGSPKHAITWLPKQGLWCVEVLSVLLVRLLKGPFSEFVKAVSHCERCAGGFLRGFFDSEASMYGRSLTLYNGSLRTMRLANKLLSNLGILASGPRLDQRARGIVTIKGKRYHSNKDMYLVYVRTNSLLRFADLVGFSIWRKRIALSKALGSGHL
jgi:intein-encoded DNA endonuclease-like protein